MRESKPNRVNWFDNENWPCLFGYVTDVFYNLNELNM